MSIYGPDGHRYTDDWHHHRVVPFEEHTRLCRGIVWRPSDGARYPCNLPATDWIGEAGYCPTHLSEARGAVISELSEARLEQRTSWIVDAAVRIERSEYEERVTRERVARRDRVNERVDLARFHASSGGDVVYFIQSTAGGPIKIGTSGDVQSRLLQLQSAHAVPLRILATEPGDVHLERAYHALFVGARLSGEWFEPVPELMVLIEHLVAQATRRERLADVAQTS